MVSIPKRWDLRGDLRRVEWQTCPALLTSGSKTMLRVATKGRFGESRAAATAIPAKVRSGPALDTPVM